MSITAKAFVVMRKGRKRKAGPRHPCGQLVDGTKIDPKIIAILQPHRRGVALELRHDAKAESALGRLQLGKKISNEQYEAGKWYAGAVARYRQSIFAPNPNPGSIAGAQMVGAGGPRVLEDEEARRRYVVYNDAVCALDKTGHRVMLAVAHTAIKDKNPEGPEGIRLLVIGLEALAVHRGLTKPKK